METSMSLTKNERFFYCQSAFSMHFDRRLLDETPESMDAGHCIQTISNFSIIYPHEAFFRANVTFLWRCIFNECDVVCGQ